MALPFLVRPGLQTEAVGDPQIGVLHFLQLGDVAVAEDPPSLQKQNDLTLEMMLVLEDVAERISKDIGIPLPYCRAKVYGQKEVDPSAIATVTITSVEGTTIGIKSDQPLSVGDWVEVHNGILVITKVIPPKRGTKFVYEVAEKVEVEAGDTGLIKNVDIDSYLTKDERINQMKTRLAIPEIPVEAATLLIQHRVLYAVQLAADLAPNAKSISLLPISTGLCQGDAIKFPTRTVQVTGGCEPTPMDVDVQAIAIAAAPGQLKAGTIGYIMRDGEYLKGAPEWTQADTRKLGNKLVNAIYAFYQKEKAAAPTTSDDDAPDVGNDSNKQSALELVNP